MARTNGPIQVWNRSDTTPTDVEGGYAGGDSTAAAVGTSLDQSSRALGTVDNLVVTASTLDYGQEATATISGTSPWKTIHVGIPKGMPDSVGQQLTADAAASADAATLARDDADAAVLLAQQAQAAAYEVPDVAMRDIINNPATETRPATETALNVGATLERFGATGGPDDTAAVQAAVAWALANDGKIAGRPGRVYTIHTTVILDVEEGGRTTLDLGGATLRFVNGARLGIGTQAPTPYLTTTTAGGVTRKGTSFTAASVVGVQVGDLVTITSPVEWVTGVPLQQTHLVADVDATTGQVWVEGRIPGDITPAQVTTAGKVGDLTVNFYRLADSVEVRNVTLDSPMKDAADTLVSISGVRRVRLDNVHVHRPNRVGLNFSWCGAVEVTGSSTREHGYATRDRGYASQPSDPGGLGFGYGFLASNCYSVQFRDCNSYSGWHGFDVARGVSYSTWDGCIAHKDAYGFSSHEGAWVMEVRNCDVIGGLGITCRASELIVLGGHYATSLGNAISGTGDMQHVVIKDAVIDCADTAGNVSPISLNGAAFNAAAASAETANVTVDGLILNGVTGPSEINVRGDATVRGIVVNPRPDAAGTPDSNISVRCSATGRSVLFADIHATGIANQFMVQAHGFDRVDMVNCHQRGTVRVSSSALLCLTGADPTVRVERCSAVGASYMARVISGAPVVSVLSCSGGQLLRSEAGTFKAAAHCQTPSSILFTGAVGGPVTNVGNVIVPA